VRKENIRPIIDSVFPIGKVKKAHERMQSSMHIGKIVLQIAGVNATT
jgi:NADPH:quinone reductase-like Zn-dependent oxidoreductase